MEMNLQIPFLLLPGIFLPPLARCAPRAGCCSHFSGQATKKNASRTPNIWLDLGGNRRTENPKACRSFGVLPLFIWIKSGFLAVIFLRRFLRSQKSPHPKLSRPISVHQGWRANACFTNHLGNARNRKLKFFRVGKARTK